MAFSLRKMFSIDTYFKKSEDSPKEPSDNVMKRRRKYEVDEPLVLKHNSMEEDSYSHSKSLTLPVSVKNLATKKGSLSDTDLLTVSGESPLRGKRKRCKKLRLDIKKASQSVNQVQYDDKLNVENTPKHVLLECKSSDVFSERFRGLDFNKSFALIDAMSDEQSPSHFEESEYDIESLSDNSDTDKTDTSNKSSIKMCRKIASAESDKTQLAPSGSIESFTDIELDKNEEERMRLLLNYQTKIEKLDCFLKKLLNEFQFHIEVSKVFHSRSNVNLFSGNDIKKTAKRMYEKQMNSDLLDSWNIITESADNQTKHQVRKHLLSMKGFIERFVQVYLQNCSDSTDSNRSNGGVKKCQRFIPRRLNVNRKKKMKYFDFPDLREAMINLFTLEGEDKTDNVTDFTSLSDTDTDISKCICKCHHQSSSSEADSEMTSKIDEQSSSITSSLGNFTLNSSTLTAFSESLDRIVSYNSYQDTSLYNTFLQKSAVDRIKFYVQVHSVELQCEPVDDEYESKNELTFYCPTCKVIQNDENGLLMHILSSTHCEKIHFLYKTAYIKKCVATGKEIQPSTVLNPMKMYRDDNKIVCFGDAFYACTLCFENMIVGESVLMAHCYEQLHMERREKLAEFID